MGGLVPAIIQDSETKDVLMLGFMNKEALKKTLAKGRVTFWSRTKNRLWQKGETSGNSLKVVSINTDCDNDTLLIMAKPKGPICHLGRNSCFVISDSKNTNSEFLDYLYHLIVARKKKAPKGSYTASLFKLGVDRIAQKVGEESTELLIAAKNKSKKRLIEESGDLLYHLLVLLAQKQIPFSAVVQELKKRSR